MEMKFDPTTNRRWIRITPGSKLERGLLRNWQKYPRDIDKSKKKAKKKKKKKKDEKLFNKIPSRNLRVHPKRYSINLVKSVFRAVSHSIFSIENEFLVEKRIRPSLIIPSCNLSGACENNGYN